MTEWFKALLASKRVQLAISALIVIFANKYLHLQLDSVEVASTVASFVALILSDGSRRIGITHEEAAIRTRKKIRSR